MGIKALRTALEAWAAARLDAVRRHPVLGEVYELLDGSLGDYARDHGPMYAAAVAFFAILSLIPLVVLLASVGGYAIHIAGGTEAGADAILNDIIAQLERAIPYLGGGFSDDMRKIVAVRSELGLVGVGALMLTASQVFRGLEFAFARIFARANASWVIEDGADMPRNFVLSKLLFGAFLTALVVAFVVWRFLLGMLRHLAESLPPDLASALADPLAAGSWLGTVVESAILVGLYVVVLKAFTHKRVQMRFALAGGVLFLGLFAAARGLYDLYLEQITDLGAVYGSFATVMTVVLWIFYLSTIVIVCAYFARTLQRRFVFGPRWVKRG